MEIRIRISGNTDPYFQKFFELSREEALRWAVDDMSPGWVVDGESTACGLGDLRGAVLEMHRQVRVVRYNTSKARPAAGPGGAL